MPGFIPVPFTSECHVRYQHGTNLLENTFGFQWSGGVPSPTELVNLATDLGTTLALRMATFMNQGVIFREVYCRNLDVEFASEGTYTFPSGVTGLRVGGAVASNEANGIIKRVGLTGRGMHGRNSFSEFSEGDVDGNSLGSTLMSLFLPVIIEILIARLSSRFKPALIKRHVTVPRSVLLTQAVDLDNNVDSQKTRLNSHGR